MRVSIPLPRRCERRTLPIELIPQLILLCKCGDEPFSVFFYFINIFFSNFFFFFKIVFFKNYFFQICFFLSKNVYTSSGDRTHDHKIKSLALYHLSYGGHNNKILPV